MRIKEESLSYWILLTLEELTRDGVVNPFSYSSQMKYLLSINHLRPGKNRRSVSEAIRRMRLKGLLIKERNEEGNMILKITGVGIDILGVEKEWDGKYRIVLWDIPESKRRVRDLLRRRLKELEFKNVQKSVWVSKRDVTNNLRKLISELEIEKWVVVVESDDAWFSHIKFHDRVNK